MNNELTKHRFLLRILAPHSNPDGITRDKVEIDAEIRGPPVFMGAFGGFREKCVLPDFSGFCQIFTPNVLPMFYQPTKMFYQIGKIGHCTEKVNTTN